MLSVEIIFMASIVALVGFFDVNSPPNPGVAVMLLSIFSVAAVEVIAVVAFYIYLKHTGTDLDVRKLSRMRW